MIAVDYDEIERLARAVVDADAVRAEPTMLSTLRATYMVDVAREAYEDALSPDVALAMVEEHWRLLDRLRGAQRVLRAYDERYGGGHANDCPVYRLCTCGWDALVASLDEPGTP